MKKVAIVVALQQEFELVANILTNPIKGTINGAQTLEGKLSGHEIILLQSGIGKVNAGIQVTELLRTFHPDFLINSGVAGGIGQHLKVADIVVSTQCCYHDVWCGEGEWGQVQGFPLFFPSSPELVEKLRQIEGQREKEGTTNKIHFGLICTGDQFISDETQLKAIKKRFPEGLAVDMESCAMSHACYIRKTPFLSLRIISDTPGMHSDNTSQYFDFFGEAPKKTFAIIQQLIQTL